MGLPGSVCRHAHLSIRQPVMDFVAVMKVRLKRPINLPGNQKVTGDRSTQPLIQSTILLLSAQVSVACLQRGFIGSSILMQRF